MQELDILEALELEEMLATPGWQLLGAEINARIAAREGWLLHTAVKHLEIEAVREARHEIDTLRSLLRWVGDKLAAGEAARHKGTVPLCTTPAPSRPTRSPQIPGAQTASDSAL